MGLRYDMDTKQHQFECEARDWLRRGYSTPSRINDLRRKLRKYRTHENIDRLVAQMRIEFKRLRK